MSLREYRRKRDFKKTREPRAGRIRSDRPIFVVQKHWASHLHYDFRLEAFGVLKSWAVPKGPSLDPKVKRLAVEVEDHPVTYGNFEGHIPKGEYGGGDVIVWDHGTWDPPQGLKSNLEAGRIDFELHGEKLKGQWLLQRTRTSSSGKNQWLLIKKTDGEAKADHRQKNGQKPKAQKKIPKDKVEAKTIDRDDHDDQDDQPSTQLVPKLAVLVDQVPQGKQWIYEIKFDGYRTFTLLNGKKIQLLTRNSLDWTKKYGDVAKELSRIKARQAVLDGEIVCLDDQGRSNFQSLQAALKSGDFGRLAYCVFDLLVLNGEDLRDYPLEERKKRLKDLVKKSKIKKLIYSEHWAKKGVELFKKACSTQLEGIVAKDKTAAYVGGRQPDWQKIKCSLRQEFVIGGYTDPQGGRADFGALLLGVYEKNKFRYCGKVGTGFTHDILRSTLKLLEKNRATQSPFDVNGPRERGVHWVKPKLIAEIEFKAFTSDGMIRQGSFQGLRLDKASSDVHFEAPVKVHQAPVAPFIKGVEITHPDRIIFPSQKITKLDVVNYYEEIKKWILPHLEGRPLSILRCTGGLDKCFFQKHLEVGLMPGVQELNFKYEKKSENIIYVESGHGLVELAQWGSLEFHTWGARVPDVLKPNLVVFDLDPAEDVPWTRVRDTAFQIRKNLQSLGLKSYVKVTGGKGVHIHVPCRPSYSWDQIKNFSHTFVRAFEEESPNLYVTKATKKDRQGKIFLDYLRNGFGATAVVPYSLRAKALPTVALPIRWDELKDLKQPNAFLLKDVLSLLARRKKDPWEGYFKNHQRIKILEF